MISSLEVSDLVTNGVASACLDDLAALAFVEGTITPARHTQIVEHLETCAECRKLVGGVVEMTKLSDTLLATADSAPGGRPESFGSFRLGALIAQGGMGSIYRAYDTTLGRDVALKVPRSRMDAIVRRFEREAAITARLEHPGIVPIHGAGQTPDGTPFYVMRFIEGRTLDALIAEATTPAARLVLVERVLEVARTMAYVHGKRIVHRDLKPNNILVDAFGAPLIIDWGLAKQLSDGRESLPVVGLGSNDDDSPGTSAALRTRAGEVMGTPAFMPPEQATGEPVDERADVYALGAILRNVLTGTLPLPADADIEGPAPVVEICKRAMAWEPADRYPDAGAFAAGLETALAGLRPGVVVARSRMRLWLAAAIAVAAIAVIAVVWGARRDAVGKAPQMRVISRVPPGQLFLSLSPDGNRLAYNGRERVHVLDLRTGQNWSLTAWTTWPWVISFDTDNVVRFGVFDERDGGLMRRTTWNFQTGEVVDVSAAASIKSGFWIGRLTIGDLFLPSDVARHMVVQSPTGTTALPSDSLRPIRLFAIAPDRDRVAFVEYGDAGERIRVIDATGRGFVSAQLQDLAAISWLDDQTLIYSVGSSHGSTLYTARMTPEGFANPSRIYQSESGGWLGSLAARPNRIIASWFTSSFETRIHTREATERPLDKSAVSAALGWLDDSTFLAYSSSTGRVERASTEPTVLPQPTSMRLPGDPANATRVGDLVIVALRGTAGTRTVLAHDLREATPRWTAAPGELLFVRCAGDRQLPCVAGKHVGATVKLLPIDPQTGKLGDTVIAEGGIADAAIDDAGTHVVFIVDNRDLLIRPLDLSVPAQPLLPVRSANHSLAIDPLGGVLASVYALDGRELARINDGKATTVLHAGTALLSLIRPSPDGKLILFRARTLVGDVVEIRR